MKMTKHLLSLALVLVTALGAAGQTGPEDIYQRYSEDDGVMAISIPRFLLENIDLDVDLEDQVRELDGEIEKIRLLIFSEDSEPEKHIRRIDSDLRKQKLEEIDPTHKPDPDDLSYLRIYGQRQGDHYKNIYLLLISDDGEIALFAALSGRIKISEDL